MIIIGLSAKNVLKYAHLELDNLPENGLIAVEGANESGKSSIGEMICFVLYGRTYSLAEDELGRLIKWGELSCSVTLRFRTGDRVIHEVTRFLDHEGNQSARLNRQGAEHDPIARGAQQVQSALDTLIGYNYEEYIESFYLAQREITTPHPHSHAVKAMAGLGILEKLSKRYGDEIVVENQLADEVGQQAEVLAEELSTLAIEPGRLDSLLAEQHKTLANRIALQQQAQQLEEIDENYQGLLPKFREASARCRKTGVLRLLALLLLIVCSATWGVLTAYPEHALSQMMVQLKIDPSWPLVGAAVCMGLFLFLWWRRVTVNAVTNTLLAQVKEIAEPLRVLGLASVPVSDTEVQIAPGEGIRDPGQAEDSLATVDRSPLYERVCEFKIEADELTEILNTRISRLKVDQEGYQQQIDQLEKEIRHERQRVDRANGLTQAGEDLDRRVADHQRRIAMRLLAQELLEGAARHFSQVFNRNLRELVGRTLPLLTQQRYEYLHIDNSLAVTVFSKEKRDFVKLEELSSGTQRQIMLALRLALSQELVNKAVKGKQFLFLDEPFAFFDQERTNNAISVLPKLSDEITQICVVAQEFPSDFHSACVIHCDRDRATLNVSEQGFVA